MGSTTDTLLLRGVSPKTALVKVVSHHKDLSHLEQQRYWCCKILLGTKLLPSASFRMSASRLIGACNVDVDGKVLPKDSAVQYSGLTTHRWHQLRRVLEYQTQCPLSCRGNKRHAASRYSLQTEGAPTTGKESPELIDVVALYVLDDQVSAQWLQAGQLLVSEDNTSSERSHALR